MKKIIALMALALLTLSLIGCATLDPLSGFINAAENNLSTINTFEDATLEDEAAINQLTAQHVMLLSTNSSTNQEKIDYIRTLFQDIRLLHAHNVIDAENVRLNWQILVDHAKTFQSLELELTDEEKTEIRDKRQALLAERAEIMETRGVIYDLFQELRGQYTIENADLIINNLEMIKAILESRADYIFFVGQTIEDVNLIVENYLP